MANAWKQPPLSNLEIAEFCNQMHLMLRSGISTLEGLQILLDDAKTDSEEELLNKLIEEIELKGFFHEAAASTNVFPKYMLQMLKLGEETGTLDDILRGLADHYTREANLATMVRSALVYPAIMLGMMTLVILVLLTKVMPIFQQVFQQLGQEMSGFSAGLLTIGNTLSRYSFLSIALLAVVVSFVFFGRKQLPFQKNIQEQIATCRFAGGMSVALKSGLTPEQGMELAAGLIENENFLKKIEDCRGKLEEGNDLATAFHQSQIFSGSYARLALIAEKTGNMDEALAQISNEYEHATTAKIHQLIAMLEPTLVMVLSAIVGIILFSVMLPLLGIMTSL